VVEGFDPRWETMDAVVAPFGRAMRRAGCFESRANLFCPDEFSVSFEVWSGQILSRARSLPII